MNFKYEQQKIQQGFHYIIGCDEVGRGCLAGPVVAAAVVLSQVESLKVRKVYTVIKDSKLLNQKQREKIEPLIKEVALAWSIGIVEREMIDGINIHNASLLAMRRAVEGLIGSVIPSECSRVEECLSVNEGLKTKGFLACTRDDIMVLLDGKFKISDIDLQQEAIIDGDAKILSIAAASIVAKVYRDNLMKQFDEQYPNYQFARHKGYATSLHRQAIKKFGLTPLHRLTFCQKY